LIAKYRKKPIVIEAIQWTGNNYDDLINFGSEREIIDNGNKTLTITTLEGNHIASNGDYIIRGIKGEVYPCKPDIFKATYEEEKNKKNCFSCIHIPICNIRHNLYKLHNERVLKMIAEWDYFLANNCENFIEKR
jgi:hypothetical protein